MYFVTPTYIYSNYVSFMPVHSTAREGGGLFYSDMGVYGERM